MNKKVIISKNISSKILTIGPNYKNHRGGIGAVISIYSKYFETFYFISSYTPKNNFSIAYNYVICLLKLFIKLFIDRKIKVIHIHGASNGSFYRKFICFIIGKYLFRKKIIYHIHGGGFEIFYLKSNKLVRKLIRLFINHSDCVVCLSNKWKFFFESSFTPNNLVIIPNVIDYPILTNYRNKETDVLTFLFLGLISNNKGIFDLLAVINKNKYRYKNKIKLIIGGNGETEKLKQIINNEELDEIVEFVGWVIDEKKVNYLQNADIYILPSYIEGLPISILEAMSYGKCIISTNIGGIPEIVHPGKNGILIEPGNKNQIESAIDFFLLNPKLKDCYGVESSKMVYQYLPNSVNSELQKIYSALICM